MNSQSNTNIYMSILQTNFLDTTLRSETITIVDHLSMTRAKPEDAEAALREMSVTVLDGDKMRPLEKSADEGQKFHFAAKWLSYSGCWLVKVDVLHLKFVTSHCDHRHQGLIELCPSVAENWERWRHVYSVYHETLWSQTAQLTLENIHCSFRPWCLSVVAPPQIMRSRTQSGDQNFHRACVSMCVVTEKTMRIIMV